MPLGKNQKTNPKQTSEMKKVMSAHDMIKVTDSFKKKRTPK